MTLVGPDFASQAGSSPPATVHDTLDTLDPSITRAAQAPRSTNEDLRFALERAVHDLLGPSALPNLYEHLRDRYDMIPEKVPYRLVTLFDVFANKFGTAAARTIAKAVARQLYSSLDLFFSDADRYELQNYLEQAKNAVVRK